MLTTKTWLPSTGLINNERYFRQPTWQRNKDYDWKLGTWNVRTLNEAGRVSLLACELQKVGVSVAAIQEVRWPRTGEREFRAVDPVANTAFKYNIYHKAEHGVGFIVIGKQMKL